MNKYDCTDDVKEHMMQVGYHITGFIIELENRIHRHDNSKLEEPEKSMYDEYTPRLKELEFGSDEYKASLENMGSALKHHYENNRHHPEHFKNGIDEMNLVDIIEMVCDWIAAAKAKGGNENPIDMDYLSERFHIDAQLRSIIINSLLHEGRKVKNEKQTYKQT